VPTLDDLDWPVRTDRLTVRRLADPDVAATWAYRRLPEVNRWLPYAPEALDDYAELFRDPDRRARTLVVELEDAVVGDLFLMQKDGWSQLEVRDAGQGCEAELGWALDPAYGGQGLATEAVEALLGICFESLGLRRVTAGCFADNVPSWRLMERVGMRRELHAVAESLHRELGWVDGYGYALLADEWRTARD
jgi:RimJ/RimL family protein N-acetyltransferase